MKNPSPSTICELSQKIEQMVQEHLESSRREAVAALERAFGREREAVKRRGPARRRTAGKRRAKEEVAALGERFYEAVCDNPGEPMSVLAAQVGASPRELHRPMTLLKEAGRLRTVGQRQFTRYFPMTDKARATG